MNDYRFSWAPNHLRWEIMAVIGLCVIKPACIWTLSIFVCNTYEILTPQVSFFVLLAALYMSKD